MNRVTRNLILWCLAITVTIAGIIQLVVYLDTTSYGWLSIFCVLAFFGVFFGGIVHLVKMDVSSVRYSPLNVFTGMTNIIYVVSILLFHYVIWAESPLTNAQVFVSIIVISGSLLLTIPIEKKRLKGYRKNEVFK